MKMMVYALMFAVVGLVGCSKDDKGGGGNSTTTDPYGYDNRINRRGFNNRCFNGIGNNFGNNFGGNFYGNYGSNRNNRNFNRSRANGQYFWRNDRCYDQRRRKYVADRYCQGSFGNFGNNFGGANCDYFGPFQPLNGFNNGICNQFNTAGTVSYPVYFPGINRTLCVEYSTYATQFAYNPTYNSFPLTNWNGYSNLGAVGCFPGQVMAGCRCATAGVQLGSFWGGLSAGVCY